MDIGPIIADSTTFVATIDCSAVITALDESGLPYSGGERSVLLLAASLADGIPSACPTRIHRIGHDQRRQSRPRDAPCLGDVGPESTELQEETGLPILSLPTCAAERPVLPSAAGAAGGLHT